MKLIERYYRRLLGFRDEPGEKVRKLPRTTLADHLASCGRKNAYESRDHAQRALGWLRETLPLHNYEGRVYECLACGQFHITTSPKGKT